MTSVQAPGRHTILVVDDTPGILHGLCDVLQDEYDVCCATNGEDALAITGANPPDLILLDVVMPGLDGYQVCERLKAQARTRDIPVIFLTSLSDESQETRGLEAGAIDYLAKPVSPALMKVRLRNHLEAKRRRDTLLTLSQQDGLTGLANRRAFDASLAAEWARAARNRECLALVMVDVDHFKRFNDACGHAAGDECLRRVAGALASARQRPVDLVARYGGEEFACLLPGTALDGARQVAQRMLDQVQALGLPHPDSPTASVVTLSLGAASLVPSPEGRPEDLVVLADRQLYEAKQAGRNRVRPETWGDPRPPVVLLVEDDKYVRILTAERLSFLGAEVVAVPDAQEALAFAARRRPSLVLADAVMPGLSGFELCTALKHDPARRTVPVVIFTSLKARLQERSLAAGADDYLSKQEDEAVLRARLRLLLHLGQLDAPPAPEAGGSLLLASPSESLEIQLQAQLKPKDIHVERVPGPAEALERASGSPAQVLALDLEGCPPPDRAWFRDLRARPAGESLPLLALASRTTPMAPGWETLFQDRLLKPFDAQETRHRVGLLIRYARSLAEGG